MGLRSRACLRYSACGPQRGEAWEGHTEVSCCGGRGGSGRSVEGWDRAAVPAQASVGMRLLLCPGTWVSGWLTLFPQCSRKAGLTPTVATSPTQQAGSIGPRIRSTSLFITQPAFIY